LLFQQDKDKKSPLSATAFENSTMAIATVEWLKGATTKRMI
jgi:hypothetical protein